MLQAEGFAVRVLNMRSLAPIDEQAILDSAERSELVVTLEDHMQIGGLYSIVCELFQREGFVANVMPIALDGKWFKPALLRDVMEYEGFTAAQISEKIKERLEEDGFDNDLISEEYFSLN